MLPVQLPVTNTFLYFFVFQTISSSTLFPSAHRLTFNIKREIFVRVEGM